MTIKTKKQAVIDELRKIKGVGDFQIVAETEKVALKKSRKTNEPTPDRLAKITKITLATVSLGNDYEVEVNKRLLKANKEDNFEASKTYCFPLTKIDTGLRALADKLLNKVGLTFTDKLSKVIFKKNDSEQLYVRVYPDLAKEYKSNSVYFDAKGEEISHDEFKVIEAEYLPKKSSAKQGGLEEKIIVNNYKIENILYLGDEDKNPINNLDEKTLKLVS